MKISVTYKETLFYGFQKLKKKLSQKVRHYPDKLLRRCNGPILHLLDGLTGPNEHWICLDFGLNPLVRFGFLRPYLEVYLLDLGPMLFHFGLKHLFTQNSLVEILHFNDGSELLHGFLEMAPTLAGIPGLQKHCQIFENLLGFPLLLGLEDFFVECDEKYKFQILFVTPLSLVQKVLLLRVRAALALKDTQISLGFLNFGLNLKFTMALIHKYLINQIILGKKTVALQKFRFSVAPQFHYSAKKLINLHMLQDNFQHPYIEFALLCQKLTTYILKCYPQSQELFFNDEFS